MYRIENLYDTNSTTAAQDVAFNTNKLSSKGHRVKTGIYSYSYDKVNSTLSIDLECEVAGSTLKEHNGGKQYNLGDQIQQHRYCCGSLFLSGFYPGDQYQTHVRVKDRMEPRVYDVPLLGRIKLYIKLAEIMGYSTLQYIVADHQERIHAKLIEARFKEIHSVRNTRSGAVLHFMQYDL